jgi:hypothetical protein
MNRGLLNSAAGAPRPVAVLLKLLLLSYFSPEGTASPIFNVLHADYRQIRLQ